MENKNTEKLLKVFLVVVIIQVLLLIGLFLKLKLTGDETIVIVAPTPTITPTVTESNDDTYEMEIDIGNRIEGTTEDIEFIADPKSSSDTVWLVRLRFENAEVLEVRSLIGMLLPACENNRSIDNDKVCVDIANNSPFIKGDKVFIVKVRWLGSGSVYRSSEDGYYNGEELSYSNDKQMIAGVETAATAITFPASALILIVIGSVLVFAAGLGFNQILNNKKADPKANSRITEGVVTASLVIMVIGTIFTIALFTSDVETQDDIITTAPPETEYVYVYLTPTGMRFVSTPVPTWTPMPTYTPMPTGTPQYLFVYITTTPSITPSIVPTLIPGSDNVYITCGAIDVNTDNIIDYHDFPAFRDAYNHICIDGPYLIGCGGKDTNTDNVVNYVDLYYFVDHYYPKCSNCTIY